MIYINGRLLFNNITMSGTWTASGTVTLPAFTVGGDISIGLNNIQTTNLRFAELDSNSFWIISTGGARKSLVVLNLECYNNINYQTTGQFNAGNTDGYVVTLRARDSGVGLVNVAAIRGAADPYFEATLPMVLNPSSAPGTPVTGHFYYDSVANKLVFYNGAAWETVTSSV